MAHMYPSRLDPNTSSPAEKRLFPIFREHLSDDFTVFHGPALQATRKSGGIDDREIDFLVAHTTYGLLAIEVKGGQITIDGKNKQWLQNGKRLKKSPIQQVKTATYDFHNYLLRENETRSFNYPTWYAVCFPDVDVTGDLAPDAPRQIILDKRDVMPAQITAAIEAIFKHYQRSAATGPGTLGITALVKKLVPSHVLRSLLSKDFETEDEQIKVLTEEQFDVLDESERAMRLLVTGCAGSGKTLLALEKARRLLGQGQDVLFTCYNRQLAQWLQQLIPASEHLKITTFHSLCMELSKQAGRTLGEYDEKLSTTGIMSNDYYDAILPNALHEAIDKISTRYDAIVVDEGQDFHRTYWQPLLALLRDPDRGTFYIFSDENQRLFSRDELPFTQPTKHLSRNLRSTREIGDVVGRYHTGKSRYKAEGPIAKRDIEIVDPRQYNSFEQAVEKVIDGLIDQGVKSSQIIVLTPLNEKSYWQDGKKAGKYLLVRDAFTEGNQIRVETVYAFKGLERPVVILTEIDRHTPTELDSLLYVALSRARNHLIVLGDLPGPSKTTLP